MASATRKGTISLQDFEKMQSGASGSSTSFAMPTPKEQLKLGSLQTASSSTPPITLSNQDRAAISKAMDDLKQVQEATNDWFRRIESFQKLFTLPSQNSSLAESAAMCDQLSGFARETTFLEQEVARLEGENYELDRQIRTLQQTIDESKALLGNMDRISESPKSPISSLLMILVSLFGIIFIIILLFDSFFKGGGSRPVFS